MKTTITRSAARALLATLALLLMNPVQAGDEGIYGAPPPADSAFIRVFNPTPEPIPSATIADKSFGEIQPYGASEFAYLPAGPYTLTINGKGQQVTLARGRLYTAVPDDGKLRLIDVDRFDNRLKSMIVLYNLTDSPQLGLKTPDGKTSVIDPVAANAAGVRAVNAVRVNLALYDGTRKVGEPRPVNLQRGRAFSLFVAGSREAPMSVWVVN